MNYLSSCGQHNQGVFSSPRGLAAVEFALVLPVLLLVLFGIINFGALMYDQAVVTNAAREGARWASIRTTPTYGTGCTTSANPDPGEPLNPCQVAFEYAASRLINFAGERSPNVTYTAGQGYGTGAPQVITVSYSYRGIGWFFGSQEPSVYSSTSVMLHE